MQDVIAARVEGNEPVEELSRLSHNLEVEAELQSVIKSFDESISRILPNVPFNAIGDELRFIANNTFFEKGSKTSDGNVAEYVCSGKLHCITISTHLLLVIGTDGRIFPFSLRKPLLDSSSCTLSYQFADTEGVVLTLSPTGVVVSLNSLSNLKAKMQLSCLTEAQIFFYLWKYCFSSDKLGFPEQISKDICSQCSWSFRSMDLSLTGSELESQSEDQSMSTQQEELEEDVDIL
jgi:hypothetical protein